LRRDGQCLPQQRFGLAVAPPVAVSFGRLGQRADAMLLCLETDLPSFGRPGHDGMALTPGCRPLSSTRGSFANQGIVVVGGDLRRDPRLQLDDPELGPLPLLADLRGLRLLLLTARFHEGTSFSGKGTGWKRHASSRG